MPESLTTILTSGAVAAFAASFTQYFFFKGKYKAETEKSKAETAKILTEVKTEAEETRQELKKVAEGTSTTSENIEKLTQEIHGALFSGKYYPDYRKAFEDLELCIVDYIKDHSERTNGNVVVPLKLMAVAMTYSWDNFISLSIPDLLRKYPKLTITLDIIYVSSDYLKEFNMSNTDKDWAVESERRGEDIKKFNQEIKRKYANRLHLISKVYSSLPQWHGWLVGENHLFLGRTRWYFEDDIPRLSVGQNEYRYYSDGDNTGKERIDLYLSWFKLYYDFQSEPVGSGTN